MERLGAVAGFSTCLAEPRGVARGGRRGPKLPGRVNGFIGSVFVVEDEPLILLELQQMLSELGWEVVHLASDIDSATEIARSTEFDLGILDVNVKGRTSSSVAEILRTKHCRLL